MNHLRTTVGRVLHCYSQSSIERRGQQCQFTDIDRARLTNNPAAGFVGCSTTAPSCSAAACCRCSTADCSCGSSPQCRYLPPTSLRRGAAAPGAGEAGPRVGSPAEAGEGGGGEGGGGRRLRLIVCECVCGGAKEGIGKRVDWQLECGGTAEAHGRVNSNWRRPIATIVRPNKGGSHPAHRLRRPR